MVCVIPTVLTAFLTSPSYAIPLWLLTFDVTNSIFNYNLEVFSSGTYTTLGSTPTVPNAPVGVNINVYAYGSPPPSCSSPPTAPTAWARRITRFTDKLVVDDNSLIVNSNSSISMIDPYASFPYTNQSIYYIRQNMNLLTTYFSLSTANINTPDNWYITKPCKTKSTIKVSDISSQSMDIVYTYSKSVTKVYDSNCILMAEFIVYKIDGIKEVPA